MGIGGDYVWCLVVVVIFMGLEEAKRAREVLKSSYGGTSYKGGTKFLWGKFSPLDTMLLAQRYWGSSTNKIYSLETYDTH